MCVSLYFWVVVGVCVSRSSGLPICQALDLDDLQQRRMMLLWLIHVWRISDANAAAADVDDAKDGTSEGKEREDTRSSAVVGPWAWRNLPLWDLM